MNKLEIHQLIQGKQFPNQPSTVQLIETHISWVLLTEKYVYKIKKPLTFSFLDFSTLEKRAFYCNQELTLNKRLAPSMYLTVLPVKKCADQIIIGSSQGKIIDYALVMKRMDFTRQMDILLKKNVVSSADIQNIAFQMAAFHQRTDKINPEKHPVNRIHEKFADLKSVQYIIAEHIGEEDALFIDELVKFSSTFINKYARHFDERAERGYIVDGHGDLHSKNIFLLEAPVIFDCIEFNDDFRRLDVLNDIAFLCMDLDSIQQTTFSKLFLETYTQKNPCIHSEADCHIFNYYKMYRANVRLKVGTFALQQQIENKAAFKTLIDNNLTYLNLLKQYYNSTLLSS